MSYRLCAWEIMWGGMGRGVKIQFLMWSIEKVAGTNMIPGCLK